MAFTGSAICTSFYTDLLNGVFDFSSDTFRMALYTSSATLDQSTTAYTTTNELPTALGYTLGGEIITVTVTVLPTSNGYRVVADFSDASWPASTFTARGGLIYDDTAAGNPSVAVIDFGQDKIWPGSNPVVFPPATAYAGFIVFETVISTPAVS